MRSLLVVLVGLLWIAGFARHAGALPEPPLQAAARALGEDQGVFAEAENGTVLAAQAADRPVHPASVTKVASSLALLEQLGPAHRFQTSIVAGGPPQDGRGGGNPVGEGGGGPPPGSEKALPPPRAPRGLPAP